MTFRLIAPGNPLLSLKLEENVPTIASILSAVSRTNISVDQAHLLGRDGKRRVPIATDSDAQTFFKDADLPTIEILYNRLDAETYDMEVEKRERDRNEFLEDENYRLSKEAQDVHEIIRRMEESRQKEREEVRELLEAQATSLQAVVQTANSSMQDRWVDMKQATLAAQQEVQAALEAARISGIQLTETKGQLDVQFVAFEARLETMEVSQKESAHAVKTQSAAVLAEMHEMRHMAMDHAKRLQSLDATRATTTQLEESVSDVEKLIQTQRESVDASTRHLATTVEEERVMRTEQAALMGQRLRDEAGRIEALLDKRAEDVRAGALKTVEDLKDATQCSIRALEDAMQLLAANTQVQEDAHVDAAERLHTKLQEAIRTGDARIAEGIEVMGEQLEWARGKLGSMEETLAGLTLRVDADNGLFSTKLATLEARSEESAHSAAEIMESLDRQLNTFQQTASKNISLLQHDNTSYNQSIAELEQVKCRLVDDWDTFSHAYQLAQTRRDTEENRMSTLLDCICHQMEPSVLEWRIDHVAEKQRQFPCSINFRSATANVSGVQLTLDWFPNGNAQKIYKEGVCILRIYAPKGTKITYEVTIGTIFSDGARDWDTDIMDLWTDVVFHDWERAIARDSITFKVEIHENKKDRQGPGPSGQKTIRIRNDEGVST